METVCVASRGRQSDGKNVQRLEVCPVEGKANCLTTVLKDNLIWQRPRGKNNGGFYTEKSPTLSANAWQENNLVMELSAKQLNPSGESNGPQQPGGRIRRLTPTECARLQTIPDWYKWECSNTQQYKMLGNGWTVEVIKHILSFIPDGLLYQEDTGPMQETDGDKQKKCGNCALCVRTYLGCECRLTDNPVDDWQDGCIDYIPED